jgi:hypothetical protein
MMQAWTDPPGVRKAKEDQEMAEKKQIQPKSADKVEPAAGAREATETERAGLKVNKRSGLKVNKRSGLKASKRSGLKASKRSGLKKSGRGGIA